MNPIPLVSADDREAWLKRRQGGITATDITKLASGSMLAKQALHRAKQEGESFTGNADTERGKMLEPIVSDWVEANIGIARSNMLYAHPEHREFLATPDHYEVTDGEGALVEIKTTKHDWTKRIPIKILRQIYWQAFVLGAGYAALVWWQVDDAGQPLTIEPKLVEITLDLEELSRLISAAEDYLTWVDMGAPAFDDDLPFEILEALEENVAAKETAARTEKTIREYLANNPDAADGLNRKTPVGTIAWVVSNTEVDEFDEVAAKAADPAAFVMLEGAKARIADLEKRFRTEKTPKQSTRLTLSPPKKEAA